MKYRRFCPNQEWRLPQHMNCSSHRCPLVNGILEYAEDNLVILNIFIKVRIVYHYYIDQCQLPRTRMQKNS